MSTFINYKKIKKTRKKHNCTGCGEDISQGESAYAWTSVDETVFTNYLHEKCGEMVESHCFSCNRCSDDGFQENFIYEAMLNGEDCKTVKAIYPKGVI